MDGTIIPSFFGAEERGLVRSDSNLTSIPLRVGEVKEIIYPDNKLSLSKKYVEYTVEVIQREGASVSSSTLYHGCLAGQLFGGFADQLHYTLRKDTKKQGQDQNGGVGIGSKVLLMCINGSRDNAVILTGLPDNNFAEDDVSKHSKDKGHNLFFEFNGCQFSINKDGEISLKFRGATDTNGDLASGAVTDAEGSSLNIDKNGSINISTPDQNQFITLNHKDKKIEIQAQEWDVSVKGVANITADSNINLKSSGVNTGAATDATILGTTYRNAESQLNSELSTGLTTLAATLTTITTNVPTVAALAPLVPIITQLSIAFQTFEALAITFLSQKNKSD